jgi:sirohydrochlorin ferrochelatase
MPRKAFSTTMDANTLKALKLLAVKQDRPLNDVLEEAAARYLAEKAAEDPDAQIFLKRAREPLEDCLAAIERRIAHIKKQRA